MIDFQGERKWQEVSISVMINEMINTFSYLSSKYLPDQTLLLCLLAG